MKAGFRVIFLHRSDSQIPFLHRLDPVNIINDLEIKSDDKLNFRMDSISFYTDIYKEYHQFKPKLLLVEYFSVTEYLNLLLYICEHLKPSGRKVLLFLAAAVSDFYLPIHSIAEHKIQSGQGDLQLTLKPVPKLLKLLKSCTCPEAFIVSFKLETDEELVVKKAKESLAKYQHDLVISNCLSTRKTRVIMITSSKEEVIDKRDDEVIEKELIKRVIAKYNDNKLNDE